MTDVAGKAQSQFTKADAFERIEQDTLRVALRECEEKYIEAVKSGSNYILVLADAMGPEMVDQINKSGKVVEEIRKKIPDAYEVAFAWVRPKHEYSGINGDGAVFIALNEQGVKEMNDRIYCERTPLFKRMVLALGLVS